MDNTTDHRVSKLYTDMYIGSGKDNPSMTIRLDRLEQCIEKAAKDSSATRAMMVGTMITVAGSLAAAWVAHLAGWRV
jgi:hypothetical protein